MSSPMSLAIRKRIEELQIALRVVEELEGESAVPLPKTLKDAIEVVLERSSKPLKLQALTDLLERDGAFKESRAQDKPDLVRVTLRQLERAGRVRRAGRGLWAPSAPGGRKAEKVLAEALSLLERGEEGDASP